MLRRRHRVLVRHSWNHFSYVVEGELGVREVQWVLRSRSSERMGLVDHWGWR